MSNSFRSVALASTTDFTIFDEEINLILEKSEAGWKCNMCNYLSKNKPHVKEHVENVHLGGIPVSCTECGKICKSRQQLRFHMNNAHRKL